MFSLFWVIVSFQMQQLQNCITMQRAKIDKFHTDCFFIGHTWGGDRICPNLKSDLAAKDHFTMCSINRCLLPRSDILCESWMHSTISFGHFRIFEIPGNKFTQCIAGMLSWNILILRIPKKNYSYSLNCKLWIVAGHSQISAFMHRGGRYGIFKKHCQRHNGPRVLTL